MPPGVVQNDIAAGTAFRSVTFYSQGTTTGNCWNIQGNTLSITNRIVHATNGAGVNVITSALSFTAATSSVSVQVLNPASGATANRLLLNGDVDLGNAGMTFSGFGQLVVNGVVSNSQGNGGVVSNGPGTLFLERANVYIGANVINGGIVVADNVTALGKSSITVNNNGTLQITVSGIFNALNLNGFGFGGNGALTMPAVGAPLAYWGLITLQSNTSINVGSRTLALVGNNGTLTGTVTQSAGASKSLTIVGTTGGVLSMQSTGAYTGVTNVLGATLLLNSATTAGAGGTMLTSGYVVSQGGTLAVDNVVKITNNRLSASGSAFIELNGGKLNFNVAANAVASSEQFNELNLGNPAGGVIGSNIVNLGSVNNTVTVGTLKRFGG